jgi:TonB family protein
MSASQNKGYYLELNESVLLAARTASLGHPPVIEDFREISLDNKATIAQALASVFPEAGRGTARVICALRPRQRFSHLAGDEESRKFFTPAALQTFAGSLPHAGTDPSLIIGLQAGNGLPLDGKPGSRWVLTGAPQASLAAMQSTLRDWKLAPSRVEAAGVAMLGAVLAELRRTSAAPVLIWDIGETASELFLVGSQSLQAVSRLAFGFDKVAESVQTELNLKFKGAAAKLFFNEFYDFSEIGPKIAERVADSLRSAVTEISAKSGAPAALVCAGLTSKQSWFTEHLAKSVALVPWQPDMGAWCDQAGLTFAGNTLQAKLSPGWLGLLSIVVASQVGESTTDSAWHPAWGRDASVAADKPSAVAAVPAAPKPTPPPAAVHPAAVPPTPRTMPSAAAAVPAAAPVSPPAPAAPRPTPPAPPAKASVPPTPAAPAIARTVSPAPPVKVPAAPVPVVKTIPPTAPAIASTVRVQPPAVVVSKTIPSAPPAKEPAAPKPVAVTPAKAAVASPAKPPEKAAVLPTVTPAAKPAPAKPAPAVPAAPSGSPKSNLAAKPATSGEPPAGPRPFLKTPAGLAVIGALVLVLAASFFFYRQFSEQKAEALRRQAQAEQHAAAEAEAARKAEQQAKTEKEARRQAEEDAARKTAAAEAARQQAAEETRRHEVETSRLLNGRGSLTIVTEPAGATIAISNFAPRVSPATISDLRLGHYAVSVTLAGYEPVNMDVEVKDNETTDPGPINLVRQTGTLELATAPPGVSFEVRPAAARFFAAGAAVKQGKTPATLTDLPTGEYVVIFSREGWPNHTENAVIESKGTAHVTSKFVGGSIEITTTPPGARVTRNGETVGTTPLTLQDQQPGDVEFTLELQGFTTTFVSGRSEPEKLLQLNATFNSQDRIAHLNELDAPPSATKTVEPAVSYQQQKSGGTAVISLTIDRDGTPKDLKVDSASDPEFGRRCLAAAAQWRFKPATIKGIPVKTRVALPFKL